MPVGAEDDAAAIVTGYGPEVLWRAIMRAAVRIRDGLPWVASNTDHTIPTAFGVAPGHGVQVADAARLHGRASRWWPGKPERPLLDETVRRVGGERPLMVGDRLDTDIEGARRTGVDSLLVLTGVTGLAELVAATPEERPTYLAADLAGLLVAARGAGGRRRRAARLVAGGEVSRTAAWRSTGDGRGRRLVAGRSPPRPGRTWTTGAASRVDLIAPSADRRSRRVASGA